MRLGRSPISRPGGERLFAFLVADLELDIETDEQAEDQLDIGNTDNAGYLVDEALELAELVAERVDQRVLGAAPDLRCLVRLFLKLDFELERVGRCLPR